MTPNNNLNVLPFYDAIEYQDVYKFYAYGHVFNLISPDSRFLPFQISQPTGTGDVTAATLHNYVTGDTQDVLADLIATGLIRRDFDGYELLIYSGTNSFSAIAQGKYYLEITTASRTWYSDIFTVVHDLSDFIRIEYWDMDNIAYLGGHIDYTSPFRNFLYLQGELGKPEYPFEEEAQERDGLIFIEKQISKKRYHFEFLANEPLCDAVRLIRLHDFIRITFKGIEYSVENIIFEPKWQEQGNLAVVTAEFDSGTVMKKIGTSRELAGDYNDDYNDDYNNI